MLAAVVIMLLAGCSSLRGTPARYQSAPDVIAQINLTAADLASLVTADTEIERNAIQNRALAVIDLRYGEFVRNVAADRADSSAAAAGTALGASTAGAFVNSVQAKTNYALFAAAVIGGFGIVNKSYFYDKTVPALTAAMGAARASVLLRIRTNQAETIGQYGGTEALRDLEDYYSAGTVLTAIAEITTRAEDDRKSALEEIRVLNVPTEAEIDNRKKLTKATFDIKDQAAQDKGNLALAALGLPTQSSPKATGLALRRAMRPPTPDRLKAVEKALSDAGLLK